jgi:hypothetical protein
MARTARQPMTSHLAGTGLARAQSAYACPMSNGSWTIVRFLGVTDHKPRPRQPLIS